MDLRNLDINNIDNLDNYNNIFANVDFFEGNNLHISNNSAALVTNAPICNRTSIINYLKLINLLFNQNDYFEFEIRVELSILGIMRNELINVYEEYKSELTEDDSNNMRKGYQKTEEDNENSEIRMRLYYLDEIRKPLDILMDSLEKRLDNQPKR